MTLEVKGVEGKVTAEKTIRVMLMAPLTWKETINRIVKVTMGTTQLKV